MARVMVEPGCARHPELAAEGRCKQCGLALCRQCMIVAPSGTYCSVVCRSEHLKVLARAQEVDRIKGNRFMHKVRMTLGFVIAVVAILALLGFVSSIITIPILTPITQQVRGLIGI